MNKKQLEFIKARSKSWHLLEGNYEDLRDTCFKLANPTEKYSLDGRIWIMHEDEYILMLSAERKFHNFLSSAKSLVDHSRVLMKNYSEAEPFTAFEERRNKIGRSPIVKLCHDLRNYFLHQKNPTDNYFTHQTWYEEENIIISRGYVRISKESLSKYSNWSKESEQIIALLENPLDIWELAKEYYDEISEFNSWVNSEFSAFLEKTY
ncbi:MAG: hypothetical protein U1D25_18370 [Hydrogenophaga sp.]|uniref:hypothetical protein n=1 Tax=Hydrogenophaga sp. TaxID=1904254 RepID=UPI00276B4A76|nr:hypothetical protein [Hydrogenophaga sp.]MDP2416662.1 hypothetical protein [Hydrogenophaga sp.]MDZ4190051.1 hypothetical protein [Hydrogenophaga sp.]